MAQTNSKNQKKAHRFKKAQAGKSPFKLFKRWFDDCMNKASEHWYDVNAVTLATVSQDGVPSARIILLQGFSEDGFQFYTNYESRKGREIEANPEASILFYDPMHARQVRITGRIVKAASEVSDRYFERRPFRHKLSAWASPQSRYISARELDQRMHDTELRFQDREIPRPQNCGCYVLVPRDFEFWEGRPNRMHDRIVFSKRPEGEPGSVWKIERLAP